MQTFERLRSLGLNVLVTSTDSLEMVETAWLQLGNATGTTDLARQYREGITAARAFNRQALQGVRPLATLMLVWRDPWMASGAGHTWNPCWRNAAFGMRCLSLTANGPRSP